jgi:hypothetical protein
VFIKNYKGWRLEDSRTIQETCAQCHNTGEHFVYVAPVGFQMGVSFRRKPLVGARKYFLACPVCGNLSKELSREQALALKP